MAKKGRTYTAAKRSIEPGRLYTPLEGVRLLKSLEGAKFDETVEVHFRLGVDVRHADQIVRGTTVLPHGTGKEMRVAVFAEGDKAREAEEAGADIVGTDDLAKQIQEGVFDFDIAIATPDMMGTVGKLGRILGPRGLMPNPKSGTVTFDVGKAVATPRAARSSTAPTAPASSTSASARSRSPRRCWWRTTAPCWTRSSAPSRRPPRASTSRASPSPRR